MGHDTLNLEENRSMSISLRTLAVASALIVTSGIGMWPLSSPKAGRTDSIRSPTIRMASGKPLGSFFEGLPSSAVVKDFSKTNDARFKRGGSPTFAVQLSHFFGFGSVVYAQSCGGCNEAAAPPTDCDGCGERNFTFFGDFTGLGFYDAGLCSEGCSTANNSYTCPGPGC